MMDEVYTLKGKVQEAEEKIAKLEKRLSVLEERSKPFKKPTFEQVSHFFSWQGLPDEAQNFYDFYESKDWKVGKSKMKNWKMAAGRWIRKNRPKENNYLNDF